MSVNQMTNLREIWSTANVNAPAAIELDGEYTARTDLFSAAASLFPAIAGKRVAVFCNSSRLEVIALLAAMHSASKIILPPTNQIEALKEISDAFDLILTDTDMSPSIPYLNISTVGGSGPVDDALCTYMIDLTKEVVFFTSGSTGKPKEIIKHLYQLDNEVQVWEQMIGAEVGAAEIHATVSHQHIYGLLFRILWPLCSFRPFLAHTHIRWEDVAASVAGGQPYLLFSSPTHLSRLDPLEDEDIHLSPIYTFSSGGILPTEFAEKATQLLGGAILEIYGSTETGGIARRFNSGHDECWTPLPTICSATDDRGCLKVMSSFLADANEPFQTEDLVEFDEQGNFTLKGRADRIVKIEGKRVSLPRVEELLGKHNWVQDVFAKSLDGDHPIIGAVVELTDEGLAYQQTHGGFRTGRELRKYLAQFEDAVTGPRRWRFVGAMPRNAQGKISAADVDQLFAADDTSGQFSFTETGRKIDEDQAIITFTLPDDLEYFKGHFTDAPLLPGVVQLHWAVEQCETVFGIKSQPQVIEKLKFKHFIFPQNEVTLELTRLKNNKVSFRYASIKNPAETPLEHSSGVLNFGALE